MFIIHLSLCCPRSKGSATSFSWSDALTRIVNNNPVALCHNFYFICLWLSENEITRNSLGPKSNFHFPSSSSCPGLAGASRRLSAVLPLSSPTRHPPPLQQPLVTVKVVRRCCQPWSRTLDNKAKVINWWWLDSNSQVRLDMSHVMPDITNICWYSDIMWHDPTFTWRLHQPPMRFMNRNRPIEPIHKSPSLVPCPTFSNRHHEYCGNLRSRVFVLRKCALKLEHCCSRISEFFVAEGHSQRRTEEETKILWIDDMTNIFVFLLTIVHLHFIILHYSKNEFICVDRIYSYPVLLPVIIIMQKYQKESSSISPYFPINQIISILT